MNNDKEILEIPSYNKRKAMDTFNQNYGYETMLIDACSPAIQSGGHLATGIQELVDQFELLYGIFCRFDDALEYYEKTMDEFKNDVVNKYIELKRIIKKEAKRQEK
ncbi:hypothetical protein AAGG74_16930 [Bacillus mexicanus]|uniref:hypothetical protein n=1 Tax=Bacillus mexicanus TaxID=2834415 RepID=UPI003D2576EA